MRAAPRGREGLSVSPRTAHIAIDVQLDGDEIRGLAGDGSGSPRPFSGWLGLLGALDGLLDPSGGGTPWRPPLDSAPTSAPGKDERP
jgi:hypothetical protein